MKSELVEQVYRQYGRELTHYLRAMCNSPEVAEDLMQETFCKALLSLPDSHTNVRAWLYTVARNLCMDHFRQTSRFAEGEVSEDQPDGFDMEETVFQGIRNQALANAISRLDKRKRELITLQYFSDLTVKEIAALTGLHPENVRVLICRAKKEIKSYLEEQGYEVP